MIAEFGTSPLDYSPNLKRWHQYYYTTTGRALAGSPPIAHTKMGLVGIYTRSYPPLAIIIPLSAPNGLVPSPNPTGLYFRGWYSRAISTFTWGGTLRCKNLPGHLVAGY